MLPASVRSALLTAIGVLALATACGAPIESGRLYVANLRSSDVSIIDIAKGRELARVPVADNPHELLLQGGALLLSNYRSAAITRLSLGGEQEATFAIPGEPHGLALAGERLAVTRGIAGKLSLLGPVDGAAPTEIELGGEPHALGWAAGRLYVVDAMQARLIEIDPERGVVTRQIEIGKTPESVAVSPDERTIAVANARSGSVSLIDRETLTERIRLIVPGAPVRVAFSPDGKLLAASMSETGRLAFIDPARQRVSAVFEVGPRPDGLAFSRYGERLYVALTGGNQVAIVAVDDRKVVRNLIAGDGPSGLVWLP